MEVEKFIKKHHVLLSTESLSSIIASFLIIRKVQVNDNFISCEIQKINVQHDKFIKFCEDSKSLSNALVNYSNDFLSMVSAIEKDNFTTKELIGHLTDLLPVAKKNKSDSENSEEQIKQISHDLINIKNGLSEYNNKIRNDPKNIDSVTNEELLAVEKEQKDLKIAEKCADIVKKVLNVIVMSAPTIAAAFQTAENREIVESVRDIGIEIATLAMTLLSTIGKDRNESIKNNNIKIIKLNVQLEDERKKFVDVIKNLDENLEEITMNMTKIKTHWEEQVNSLNENIRKLERQITKINIKTISNNAEDIKKEALKYNRIMNLILTNVRLAG
ncbi:hypothetical protein Glove_423g40 [Diversispora epigaea]|uniref:Uncharacterized protein n=1 Tax=Diversispora epigaea TaxID=1348612 RepID=A0A397GUM7_9GLOM|nr:hypothetical protein Glove_423g40 [Diversispora epigaea]